MLRLLPMDEHDFQAYLKDATASYAKEKIRAGQWHPSEAFQRAEKSFETLLPDGLASENHYIYSIVDAGSDSKVGMIWFTVNDQSGIQSAFIYDFIIFEEYQHRGYGKQTLLALESSVARMGIDRIALHVLGHNRAARALYEKMGYEVTNIRMAKQLQEGAP